MNNKIAKLRIQKELRELMFIKNNNKSAIMNKHKFVIIELTKDLLFGEFLFLMDIIILSQLLVSSK